MIRILIFDYYPFLISRIVYPTSKHPIVNNMDAVMFLFVSSIDTIAILR